MTSGGGFYTIAKAKMIFLHLFHSAGKVNFDKALISLYKKFININKNI